jgi:adenine deaminase
VTGTVHVKPVSAREFEVRDCGQQRVRVIELVEDQVVTRAEAERPTIREGLVVADPDKDLAKVAVVERHHASGRMGVGFVRGFGLQEGAFAGTVSHDAHNMVVVGVTDHDMAACVRRLAEIGGGLVVCRHGRAACDLPLEIAGLMSTRSAEEVAASLDALEATLREMGVRIATPFMYLGFLALSVIPELRLTDQGLVDVRAFELVPLGLP